MKRQLIVLVSVFIILLPTALSSLTVEQGRVRLVLHEDSGRFSLYYLSDIDKDEYVSLLFQRDPRTSSTGILHNNRVITLGSSNVFTQQTTETSQGARFTWTSSQLEIHQDFRFVKSTNSGLADGIRIDTTIINKSEDIQSVGVHHLFDTYLGEKRDAHFITSDNEELESETGYSLRPPSYWVSPTEQESGKFKGLISMLKGSGITLPDKVVFANWKRLSENLWNMQVQSNRNFNLLPYSINDSAVCQFYDPIKLAAGDRRTITAALGAFTGSPLQTTATESHSQTTESDLDQILSSTKSDSSGKSRQQLVREDLIAVNDIISQINSLLSFPEDISEEKIEVLEKSLNNLREKQRQYQNSD
ncbi:MAG: hypothetical protein ACOC2P_01935 [Spirochaetota bacterium]